MPIALGELDLDEVLRYMGTPPSQAGPELRALVEECGRAVCAAARPRWAWRAFDIAEEADGVRLSCGLLLPGQDLKRHLRGVRTGGGVLRHPVRPGGRPDPPLGERGHAAGPGLDCPPPPRWSRCATRSNWSPGHFPGCFFPFRYSPGYGDLPLEPRTPCWTCWTPHGGWGCAPAPATSSPPASR